MNDVSKELLSLLDLEPLELNLFRGIGTGGETSTRIFGGHVIAQALAAAYRTVEERMCHSLHAYFVRPGDPSMPVVYQVDRTRDGGSFTTRRIVAVQNGKQILTMSASFH
ncbi:MAG: acyl-CoA thioesterase, partial [Paracoccaceae bacterium]